MKRKFAEAGHADDGDRLVQRPRTERPVEPPPAALESSEPRTTVFPSGRADIALSTEPLVSGGTAPASSRVRFRVETSPSRPVSGPVPTPAIDHTRSPGQIIAEGDMQALRALLYSADRGWSIVDKAGLLRHAAGAGKLDAFNVLIEHGALQALRDEVPRADRRSLLEYAAAGQNLALLERLAECGHAIHTFAHDQIVTAIALSARKGGMAFLQRLCDAADFARIRFRPVDMRRIFVQTVMWEKNEYCQRVASTVIMEWLMARYVGSFESSVFEKPLWKAVEVGNWLATEYLLGVCGASPHLIGDGGRSLLMLAAAKGRFGLYELLRAHGADAHAIDEDGQTVLHHAVKGTGQHIVSDLVLQCRVDTQVRDKDGNTAAERAIELGKVQFVNIMQSQPLKIDYLSQI